MPPVNHAAIVATDKAPLTTQEQPFPTAGPNEIIIQNKALAINPVDWVMQEAGTNFFPNLTFPFVPTYDAAGIIHSVGSEITDLKVGDRVVGLTFVGAAQEYVKIAGNIVSKIPDRMSFEEACVLPLGLSTAAVGLFDKNWLGLQLPTFERKERGETVIVWSGGTSVGSNGIQLARAAGYEVITTCSPKNNEYVKKLGASQAFDYKSETVVEDIIAALRGKKCAGALAVGHQSSAGNGDECAMMCAEIVRKSDGKKFVARTGRPDAPTGWPEDVRSSFVLGGSLKDTEVGKAIYRDFLGDAMEKGVFVAAPEPLIAGKGVESVKEAFAMQKKGVSARKVVVSL